MSDVPYPKITQEDIDRARQGLAPKSYLEAVKRIQAGEPIPVPDFVSLPATTVSQATSPSLLSPEEREARSDQAQGEHEARMKSGEKMFANYLDEVRKIQTEGMSPDKSHADAVEQRRDLPKDGSREV